MKTVLLNISGMHCESCITHLSQSLGSTHGVKDVDVDLLSRTARARFDEHQCAMDDLLAAVRRVGFQVDGFTFQTAEQGHRRS